MHLYFTQEAASPSLKKSAIHREPQQHTVNIRLYTDLKLLFKIKILTLKRGDINASGPPW